MKKTITKFIVAIAAVALFAVAGAHAYAADPYVAWNKDVKDCPTVSVANHTTQENAVNTCWGSAVSANPGETVNVRIYYHNTGTANTANAIAKLNMPTGTRSSFSFTGFISGSGAQAVGSGSINLSAPATLTLSHIAIYKDQGITPQYVSDSSIFGAGLSIGQINAPATCPASNSFCHSGSIVVSFIVGSASNTGSACSITSFTANPSQVSSGSSSTLSWNTTGCNTVTISGINGSFGTSGSTSTGAIYGTQTYTLTATGSDGVPRTQTQTVSVNQQACSITSFYASPTQVSSGSSSTLSWNTNGCTNVTVSGQNVSSNQLSGSALTGAIYGSTTYTITASGTNTVTQSVTVSTNASSSCNINSFYASPTTVNYGGYTNLYWTTNGCTNATISGGTVNGVQSTNGNVTTGPIYNTTTYTLTAYGNNGVQVSQSLSVWTGNNNNQSCVVGNAYASPSTVVSGGSTTLYWTNNSGGAVSITGGSINSSYQYGSSITTGPIYSTTTYVITPTNCTNGGYAQSQSVTVYVNGNQGGSIAPITTLATNVSAYSARLNGLITGTSYGSVNAYFEYGTDQNLGLQTTQQTVTAGSMTNYFDTISTSPNTTYYYRAAIVVNGTVYRGSIISFTTPGLSSNGGGTVYVNTNTTTGVSYGVGAGSAFLSLSMTDQFQGIAPGDMIIYTINYKNITTKPLTNAVLNVMLPEGVTFRQSTQGMLTTNNTIVANLGTINSLQEGTITIQAIVNDTVTPGSTLVATTTIVFTTPAGAQDSAVAYAVNTVTQRNYLAGLALFGYGFFPSTLLGWIILIAIIILLILLARRLTTRHTPVVVHTSGNDHHHDHGSHH